MSDDVKISEFSWDEIRIFDGAKRRWATQTEVRHWLKQHPHDFFLIETTPGKGQAGMTDDIRQTDIDDRAGLRLKALEMADRNTAPESDKRGDKVLRLARRYLKFLEGSNA